MPTSLNVERSAVLIEISRQLKKVIEDYEIQALFRVTTAQARAMRTTLLATYSDATDVLTLGWSLVGAKNLGRANVDKVVGTKLQFASEDRRDAFIEQNERAGIAVAVILGDAARPFQAVVADDFPSADLPSPARKRQK